MSRVVCLGNLRDAQAQVLSQGGLPSTKRVFASNSRIVTLQTAPAGHYSGNSTITITEEDLRRYENPPAITSNTPPRAESPAESPFSESVKVHETYPYRGNTPVVDEDSSRQKRLVKGRAVDKNKHVGDEDNVTDHRSTSSNHTFTITEKELEEHENPLATVPTQSTRAEIEGGQIRIGGCTIKFVKFFQPTTVQLKAEIDPYIWPKEPIEYIFITPTLECDVKGSEFGKTTVKLPTWSFVEIENAEKIQAQVLCRKPGCSRWRVVKPVYLTSKKKFEFAISSSGLYAVGMERRAFYSNASLRFSIRGFVCSRENHNYSIFFYLENQLTRKHIFQFIRERNGALRLEFDPLTVRLDDKIRVVLECSGNQFERPFERGFEVSLDFLEMKKKASFNSQLIGENEGGTFTCKVFNNSRLVYGPEQFHRSGADSSRQRSLVEGRGEDKSKHVGGKDNGIDHRSNGSKHTDSSRQRRLVKGRSVDKNIHVDSEGNVSDDYQDTRPKHEDSSRQKRLVKGRGVNKNKHVGSEGNVTDDYQDTRSKRADSSRQKRHAKCRDVNKNIYIGSEDNAIDYQSTGSKRADSSPQKRLVYDRGADKNRYVAGEESAIYYPIARSTRSKRMYDYPTERERRSCCFCIVM